jgi:hypothetical protein
MSEITHFIKNTPEHALKDFFTQQGFSLSTDAANDNPLAALLTAVDHLNDKQKQLLQSNAERINAMSEELGMSAFLSVIDDHETFFQLENGHARSLWVFLNHNKTFKQAEEVRYADQYHEGKRWDGFEGPKDLTVLKDDVHIEQFKTAFKKVYPMTEDIHIDIFPRTREHLDRPPSQLYQVTIYLDDLAINKLSFENHLLTRSIERPVLEHAIIYEPSTGTVEVVAGKIQQREQIAKIFSETLLEHPIEAERLPLKKYHLNKLLVPMDFSVDENDGIESVTITMLKFRPEHEKNRFQVELHPKEVKTIHSKMFDWYAERNQLRGGTTITHAKLVIRFTKGFQESRNKVLAIKLSSPNGCDLKSRTGRELLIGEKYLKRWQLMTEV